MKALVAIIILSGFAFAFSYGQTMYSNSDDAIYRVSLQLELRNPDGKLITYVEPTEMYISDISGLHEYLDTMEDKKTVTINGKTMQQVEFSKSDVFPRAQQVNMYLLSYNYTENFVRPVLHFRHDGYFTNPGDTLTANFNVIRTME